MRLKKSWRDASSKTRIETLFFVAGSVLGFLVGEMLPAKQGLKLGEYVSHNGKERGWRDASSKTRIETEFSFSATSDPRKLERCFQQNKD